LPIHPNNYQPLPARLNWFIRSIKDTLVANGWKLTKTHYLDPEQTEVDVEIWSIGEDVPDNMLVIDWWDLAQYKGRTQELRKLVLTQLAQYPTDHPESSHAHALYDPYIPEQADKLPAIDRSQVNQNPTKDSSPSQLPEGFRILDMFDKYISDLIS
jgi:hypothetical protein